jgi:hypothetical protein
VLPLRYAFLAIDDGESDMKTAKTLEAIAPRAVGHEPTR